MMKKSIILALCLVVAMIAQARNVRDFFASEPNDIFLQLTRTARLDLLDYYDSGQVVTTRNNMAGGSMLIKVEENYLAIKMSTVKKVEMLVTTHRNDTVIVVIETLDTPVKDSHISFFGPQWERLDSKKIFEMPTLAHFVARGVRKQELTTLEQDLPFLLVEMTLDEGDHTTLVAQHRLKEFLAPQEWAGYEKLLQPQLRYTLKGTKWKLVK